MDTPRKRQRALQEVLEMRIEGNDLVVEGRLLKSVRLEHEWHDDIQDPETFRMALHKSITNSPVDRQVPSPSPAAANREYVDPGGRRYCGHLPKGICPLNSHLSRA
jgi:hypothetical protein